MFKSFLTLILIINFGVLHAQHFVSGHVYQQINKNRTPLVDASVYWENSSTGTVTNDEGYFSIAHKPENTTLVISYLGFKTVKLSSGFHQPFEVVLIPSLLDGSSHWNACPTGGDNKSNTDDFGFIEALIQELSSQYKIDQSRIYAAGYSNGAMMAYGLANYKSERIAAMASVSGTMLDCIGNPQHPMPVLHLHGTADSVIPYNGDNYYAAAQNVLYHWVDFNNTRTTPVVSSESTGGNTIERYVYNQGDNNVSVEHYKYIGGEHVWFSSTFQGQSTAELIWSFLSKHDINGLR